MTNSCFQPATPREQLMVAWLGNVLQTNDFALAPMAAGSGMSRHFRISALPDDATCILMDAAPPRDDCRRFVAVAALLHEAGLNTPRILAQDVENGFLLHSDRRAPSCLDALDATNADQLIAPAIEALVRWQLTSRPAVLPSLDAAAMLRALDGFREWYVGRHLKRHLTAAQSAILERIFASLVANSLGQPQVFVHGNYIMRNLVVALPYPDVLGFEEAASGPIAFDVAALLRDACLDWEEDRVLDWTIRYWSRARQAGLPVCEDFGAFYRDVEWAGLQRHLGLLGIGACRASSDNQLHHLDDSPRLLKYVRHVAARYDQLKPLGALLDELHGAAPGAVAYTF